MTLAELRVIQLREDKKLLAELERKWPLLAFMKVLAETDFDRYYWAVLERKTEEEILALTAKMVRRYI